MQSRLTTTLFLVTGISLAGNHHVLSAQAPSPPTFLSSRPWSTATVRSLELALHKEELVVELSDGSLLRARRRELGSTRSGSSTWLGEIEGAPGDYVALVLHEDAVAGVVRHDGRLSRIHTTGGRLWTEEHDPSAFPQCGLGPEHAISFAPPVGKSALVGDPIPHGTSGDTVVDVLVLWTPQAQTTVGGAAAIQALIDLAVLETNVAYENSGVELDLRLVHSTLVDYAEAPAMATDLARLRDKTDGFLDVAHSLRDAFGADGVSLIVSNTNPCGVGYLMSTAPSPTFERSAFNAVSYSCATGNYSFAHEFGHNFGLSHDRINTTNTPSQPYAFGYRTTNNAWRTIMAIFQGSRIQYFSNPDKTFQGFPLGIAPPASNSADNARALNTNAPTISAWRPTIVPDTDEGLTVRSLPTEGHSKRYVLDDTAGRLKAGAVMAVAFPDGSLTWGTPWKVGQRSQVFAIPLPPGDVPSEEPVGLLIFGASGTIALELEERADGLVNPGLHRSALWNPAR